MTNPGLAAPLALSGRYAEQGRAAAAAIEEWGAARGVAVEILDDRSEPSRSGRIALDLATRHSVLLGPYGSGPARAVAAALADAETVVWNHGGAAVSGARGRWVDVLSPADRYWAQLPAALAELGDDPGRVAIVAGRTEFGRTVAAGADGALRRAGVTPLCRLDYGETSAASVVAEAVELGAAVVVSGARIEDEIALGKALAGSGARGALVVCGIARAAEEIGSGIEGWIGPAQWAPEVAVPPIDIGPRPEYPAAQALAACLLHERAQLRAVRRDDPGALWDAAVRLGTRTFFGAFGVDRSGRQIAHAPALVRWERAEGRLRRTLLAVAAPDDPLRDS